MIGHAVVLKNYFPQKNKVTILHERFGKITIFIHEKHPARMLCNGSLMYCDVIKKQATYHCDFVDPYFIPYHHTMHDLYFIHDILKICLQFMPDQVDSASDIFTIITDIYQHLESLESCHKKIYLLKLFLYLGIFPENKKLYQHVMQSNTLHTHDSDALLQQGLRYCWDSDINYS